jgi:KaiC/GvpD/RAD55 family RecA-like ATPase
MIREKVKIGIPGLDEMLDGGLIPGRPYLISGTPGTGKTMVAMRFLLEGALRGEDVLFVSLDEPPNELKADFKSLGWDINKIRVFDATPDVLSYDKTPVRDVSTERRVSYFGEIGDAIRRTSEKGPTDMTVNTVQELLKQEMKVRKYTRIVVDSITSLKHFFIRTSEEYATVQSFFRLMSDLGITSILTVDLPEVAKEEAEAHQARGEIRLHKWFDGKGLQRGVTIEKYRGSSHEQRMRLLRITDEGVVVKTSEQPKPKDEGKETKECVAPAATADAKEEVKAEGAKPEPAKGKPDEHPKPVPSEAHNEPAPAEKHEKGVTKAPAPEAPKPEPAAQNGGHSI